MKRTGIAIIVLAGILLAGETLWAKNNRVAVVWIDEYDIYADIYNGFVEEKRRNVKLFDIRKRDPIIVKRRIREIRPDLILAIGGVSLESVVDIKDIPIVYASPLFPQDLPLDQTNISGVRMILAPGEQLKMISGFLPEANNIRIIYSAKWTRDITEMAKAWGVKNGKNVITRQVPDAKGYLQALAEFETDTDAYLMYPDFTLNGNVVEFIMRFSHKFKVPVFTFSEKYLREGALLSIGVVFREIGRQAWRLADPRLAGTHTGPVHTFADKPHVIINFKTAGKMKTRMNLSAIAIDEYVEDVGVVSK